MRTRDYTWEKWRMRMRIRVDRMPRELQAKKAVFRKWAERWARRHWQACAFPIDEAFVSVHTEWDARLLPYRKWLYAYVRGFRNPHPDDVNILRHAPYRPDIRVPVFAAEAQEDARDDGEVTP